MTKQTYDIYIFTYHSTLYVVYGLYQQLLRWFFGPLVARPKGLHPGSGPLPAVARQRWVPPELLLGVSERSCAFSGNDMSLYVYISICTCVYIYIHNYVYACVYVCIHTYIHI